MFSSRSLENDKALAAKLAAWARRKGAGLASAELLPGARVVRAFNAVGYNRMGFEPVAVGGLAMGRHLMPGTPLSGEHTPDEIRRIAATLK
jgi:predicted dinucleotide-binding enzyme